MSAALISTCASTPVMPHHADIPFALGLSFHGRNIPMEPLSLIFTVITILRKIVKMGVQKEFFQRVSWIQFCNDCQSNAVLEAWGLCSFSLEPSKCPVFFFFGRLRSITKSVNFVEEFGTTICLCFSVFISLVSLYKTWNSLFFGWRRYKKITNGGDALIAEGIFGFTIQYNS